MRKLTALFAGGIGYVLGARAGRQRYEQLRQAATRVKSNPKVQQTAQQAKEAAPVLKEKVTGAATAATSKVKGSDSGSSAPSTSSAPMGTTEPAAASTASMTVIPPATTTVTSPTAPTTTPPSPASGVPLTPPPA